jgi:hypothetical protein
MYSFYLVLHNVVKISITNMKVGTYRNMQLVTTFKKRS